MTSLLIMAVIALLAAWGLIRRETKQKALDGPRVALTCPLCKCFFYMLGEAFASEAWPRCPRCRARSHWCSFNANFRDDLKPLTGALPSAPKRPALTAPPDGTSGIAAVGISVYDAYRNLAEGFRAAGMPVRCEYAAGEPGEAHINVYPAEPIVRPPLDKTHVHPGRRTHSGFNACAGSAVWINPFAVEGKDPDDDDSNPDE